MENKSLESKTYFDVFKLLLSKPGTAFKIILEKSDSTPKLFLLGLYGLLNEITPVLLLEKINGEVLLKIVFQGLAGIAIAGSGIWLLSHLINLLNNILGGEAEFDDAFTIFTFSLTPMIIILLLLTIIGLVTESGKISQLYYFLLILPAFTYTIVLLFIGNEIVSKNSFLKNLVAIAIPITGMFFGSLLPIALIR